MIRKLKCNDPQIKFIDFNRILLLISSFRNETRVCYASVALYYQRRTKMRSFQRFYQIFLQCVFSFWKCENCKTWLFLVVIENNN